MAVPLGVWHPGLSMVPMFLLSLLCLLSSSSSTSCTTWGVIAGWGVLGNSAGEPPETRRWPSLLEMELARGRGVWTEGGVEMKSLPLSLMT